MSLLDQVKKPSRHPLSITILGDAGVGKTSLAATFPKPIMITVENGTNSIIDTDVVCFPEPKNYNDVLKQITTLIKEDHDYKTLIIDSVSALDLMCIDTAIEEDFLEQQSNCKPDQIPKKRTINNIFGGYGNGAEYVGKLHARVRTGCEKLRAIKKMNIVFIGHSVIKELDLPDSTKYSYFDIRMTKQAKSHYIDNVDIAGYMKIQSFIKVKDEESNKIVSNRNRVIICHANLAYITKNRFGIEDEILVEKGVNPFSKYLISEE